MNTPTPKKHILPLVALSASWSLLLSAGLQAQTAQTWNNAAASGSWTLADANWNSSVWTNNNNAVFGSTTGITVTSSTDIVVNDITFSTTGYTVAGALKLANDLASTITVNTDAATISANISNNSLGASSLTKSGTGMLVLSGSNSYSGTTTFSQGILAVNSAYALGAGTLVISNGTLNNTSGSAVTLATNNAQKWTGSFSYSGTGTLNLGTGAVSIATGGGANTSVTITTTNGNLVIGGVISGTNTYGISKTGNGTLTLTGLNTYGFATIVTGGTLVVNTLANGGVASSIGSSSGASWALQLKNGAALVYTGTGSTTDRSLHIDTAGIIDNEGTGALVFSNASGVIDNNGDTSGTANKTLTFTGTNAAANTVALKIGDPTTGKTTSIVKNGTGFWAFTNSNNSYTGTTTINAGVLSTQSIANGGVNSGIGASTSAASNLVLAGGTLQYTGAAVSTDRLFTVTTNGGGIDGSGSGISFTNTGALVMSGTGTRTLTLTGTSTANSLAAQIQDNGGATSLVKNGSGTWTLSGANNFSGGVTVNVGQLTIGNAYALGTGTLTINGGALATASGTSITLATNNAQIWAGDFYYGGGTLDLGTGGITLTANRYLNVISGNLVIDGIIGAASAYNLTKTGAGTLILTGSNTFTGALVITGGTVAVNSLNNGGVASSTGMAATDGWALQLKTASLVYTGTGSTTNRQMYIDTAGTIDNEGTGALIFSNTGGTIGNNISGSGTANRTITLTGTNTANNTIGLQIADPAAAKTTTIVKSGIGYWLLSGANTYSGTTSVQNGTLGFQTVASGTAAQSLGSGNTVTLGVAATSSGTLQYNGVAGTLDKNIYALGTGLNTIRNSGSGLLTLAGSLIKDGTILVLDGGSKGITVTGTISGSSANSDLYITGGTTTLAATNTYSGPTWVYGGGILVNGNANGALPTDTVLTLGGADNSTGTFNLNGNSQTIAGLSSTGTGANIVTNNGTNTAALTVTNGGTFSGTIKDGSSATSLVVSGGNLILSGSNYYTGATSVTGGTLGVNGSLGNSAVNISSAAVLNGNGTVNGTVVNSGTISGSLIFRNNVTINAGATASASAFNGNIVNNGTITSAVTVQQGKVLSGSGAVSANVTVNSATINGSGLNLGATTLTGASQLSGINNASTVTVQNGSTSLTGTTTATSLTVSAGAVLSNSGVVNAETHVSGLLQGAGIINGNISLSGTLAPGSGIGGTTINGNLTMDSSAKLVMEVSGSTAGSFDTIKVSGNVILAGALDLTSLSGLTVGSSITLIDNIGTSSITQGYFASILTSGSTYTITDSGSSYIFSLNGTEYVLNYASNADGDGIYNDVTLSAIPEPSTWAMILGGMSLLLGMQRRRSSAQPIK